MLLLHSPLLVAIQRPGLPAAVAARAAALPPFFEAGAAGR